MKHRYNPYKRPRKKETEPRRKPMIVKELEQTRDERRSRTWAHAEKYCRENGDYETAS